MPATEATPTSVPEPRACIGFTKGAKVRTSPSTLMSNTASNAGRSSCSPVSVPTDTPALPMTMSGTPTRAMKSSAAARSASVSRTSAV